MHHTITTARLLLRPYLPADEEPFVALFASPDVTRHMSGPGDEAGNRALFRRVGEIYRDGAGKHHEIWAVAGRERPDEPFGHAELKETEHTAPGELEIVYALEPAAWGQGYGSELVQALVAHGLAQGARAIIATVDPANGASIRLLEKAGLRYERTLHPDDDEPYLLYRLEQR